MNIEILRKRIFTKMAIKIIQLTHQHRNLKTMTNKGLILFCFVITSTLSLAQNKFINVLEYDIHLSVNDDNNIIEVVENVQIEFTENCSSFQLDLVSEDKNGTGMTVLSCREYSDTISFRHVNDTLTLFPNHGHVGDVMVYEIIYRGIPADGLVIGENKFNQRTFFGDNWPNRARNWIACNDHPSDKALVHFSVEAPDYYEVVSNGIKTEEKSILGNRKKTVYRTEYELPTKVMVVGIADFVIKELYAQENTILTSWVYPEDETNGFKDMEVAKDPFQFFVKNIGPYPFEKLANVQSTTRFGGMENAGCIFYDENAVKGEGTMENLIAHEIAHQWFGNSASESDWCHLWLSEGFATYFTNLHIEHKYGRDAMNSQLEKDKNRIIKFSKQFNRPLVDTITTNLMQLLNPYAYQKGSWVLHMLRHKIGDELFWLGIRKYYDTYKYSNASSEDFISIMETMSEHDLADFFNQWLKRDYHPQLKISKKNKCKGKLLTIEQVQNGELFHIDLEVEIVLKDGTTKIETITDLGRLKKIKLRDNQKIIQINIDPNNNLLYEKIN